MSEYSPEELGLIEALRETNLGDNNSLEMDEAYERQQAAMLDLQKTCVEHGIGLDGAGGSGGGGQGGGRGGGKGGGQGGGKGGGRGGGKGGGQGGGRGGGGGGHGGQGKP
ncbi:uncharacterized protein LOC130676959 [Microplitis mediator]|uniref:uncharacterized protein LOC130676959 n=1 Tax=Microplitis mediator TaxID=375433 RepID=UPI002554C2B2|nr:uncharacterized protein LOC130676959 [Microplitis mediator]